MNENKLISIVVPVFNESETIDAFFETLNPALVGLSSRYNFEIIFTDNHSTDDTFEKLADRAAHDSRVRVIRFSRNFGYQRSILTAYTNARGAAAIQLDCDLQDPPALIEQFLDHWEDGYKVVYGVRRSRKEGWLIRSIRRVFYRLVDWLSDIELPHHAGDFRIIDRQLLDLLSGSIDCNPYLRGMISRYGFKQIGIPYDRDPRTQGKSKFGLSDLFTVALDGIVSQSTVPLRFATHTGLLIAFVMFVAIIVYSVGHVFFGATWPPGFATTTVLILFGISINAMFLGIIGEYIARIYQQSVKDRITIVEKTVPESDAKIVVTPGK
ncbi:MAG: glycosyltransferase family 2 protein [Rhodospirillaceae bacterium]|jgi:polyisoprenyl-phosphate glycosyltransferase|nr:glycosyltransferase family 2 protein [Rhodospirillales bacterium]MBT3906157.1 glycosyltransferase family 2 protein [Rhodospirillaceae bacterium]MBT4702464.1 glycosyltransferase family 2 protein [Rhodospirillaceae bacterium]MBT5034817.1 glycosyltransferase family 2 protein [Rhodospirillaceae bacterium]MBT6218538.1 glycosyltransferase family 2 protein [Rhodospirillaceae bacterium]